MDRSLREVRVKDLKAGDQVVSPTRSTHFNGIVRQVELRSPDCAYAYWENGGYVTFHPEEIVQVLDR